MMTLRGGVPTARAATVPCKEATEALIFAFAGVFLTVFCFIGLIFGLLAVNKALSAKKIIELNPMLSGWGKANAALIVGTVASVSSILFMISVLSATNRR